MNYPQSEDYIEFLEREFLQVPHPVTEMPGPRTTTAEDGARWARAAGMLQPRSRLGFLFGVGKRDVAHATALLAGTSEFQLPVRALKRVIDLILALALLVILAPAMIGIGLAIRLSSPGPTLFRQTRIGKGGRAFTMWKFRTMVVDAHQLRATLADGLDHDGVMFKIRHDPRVTSIGRMLRRSSLDELPQLWNVLRGDMSIVGPRPPLPEEVKMYDASEGRRLLVKPGMTGLWQVSGRANLSWEETVRLDLRYVDNWSISLDFTILKRTIRAVVTGEGAY